MGKKRVIPIHHNADFGNDNIGMLLPIGVFLHKEVQEASIGAELSTLDGGRVVLLHKAEIGVNTPISEALCLHIYNAPLSRVMAALNKNWGDDMYNDLLLYIVVRWKRTTSK